MNRKEFLKELSKTIEDINKKHRLFQPTEVVRKLEEIINKIDDEKYKESVKKLFNNYRLLILDFYPIFYFDIPYTINNIKDMNSFCSDFEEYVRYNRDYLPVLRESNSLFFETENGETWFFNLDLDSVKSNLKKIILPNITLFDLNEVQTKCSLLEKFLEPYVSASNDTYNEVLNKVYDFMLICNEI